MAKINVRTALFLMVVLLSIAVCKEVEEDDCPEKDEECGTCRRYRVVAEDNIADSYITCIKCSEKSPNGKKIKVLDEYEKNKTLGELSCTRVLSTGGIIGIVLGVVGFFVIIGGVFVYYKCSNINKGSNRIQNTETGGNTQNMQYQQPNNKQNGGTVQFNGGVIGGQLNAGGNI